MWGVVRGCCAVPRVLGVDAGACTWAHPPPRHKPGPHVPPCQAPSPLKATCVPARDTAQPREGRKGPFPDYFMNSLYLKKNHKLVSLIQFLPCLLYYFKPDGFTR